MAEVLRIAVQGCAHGELTTIYKSIETRFESALPDLLIILGDFQSLRDEQDMASIAVPDKYKKMGDFYKYYTEELTAPVPTVFIGGNHECMRGLAELPFGGFVAKNLYYMGYSGSIVVQGIEISGLSGIYKRHDFNTIRPSLKQIELEGWGNYVRNLYHVRKSDVLPLFMLNHTDIMLSHDWPNGVVHHGDTKKLLKLKPFFKDDVRKNELGSPVSWQLLRKLMPKWWLSAHLHVKFEAEVTSNKRALEEKNPEEIDLDLDLDLDNSTSTPEPKTTKFLALDKCGRNRKHLEMITVNVNSSHPTFHQDYLRIYLNPEFLANREFLSKEPQTGRLEDIDFDRLREQRGEVESINWEDYILEESGRKA
ncbi:LAME_0D07602g1_1 [Lachancea meyersii CBS 8951]|uniref:LAME_0D07602g1_1 n=1 Tax=Lachancea meyersii CBS 8951 TaxID=1266667 RepID=A0A1G4JA29_9SACH|nr:LAME_0D07602g1_1 [Lachancea meyersii CBS 8951]